MNNLKYVGLIECNESVTPYELDTKLSNGFQLKKVLVKKNSAAYTGKIYPEAEIVCDKHSIFDDRTIELVIFSGSRNGCFNLVEQALKAGKYVRLM